MFVPLPVSSMGELQEVNFATSFEDPYCCVCVLQHYWQCGSSIIVCSTERPLEFEVFQCPLPWHTLCTPQHWDLCQRLGCAELDPFDFVRCKGSWPGKVLLCFTTELDDEDFSFRSFTDVWSYCPCDPVPLVPSAQALVPGSPIWAVHRFWGASVPSRFWKCQRHEYLMTATDELAPMRKLEELALATLGLLPIRYVNFYRVCYEEAD